MRLFRHVDDLPDRFRHGAVAIGKFDGVHLGHARIVERLLQLAGRLQIPAVVFTLEPLPARILDPEHAPAPLCWIERKAELLGQLGVEAVLAYPTDAALLRLEAREFFDRVLRGELDAQAVVEGPNFFFGRSRGGNVQRLRAFCDRAGIPLEVVDRIEADGQIVSSSRIRSLISAGRMEEAGGLLTQPYRLRGTVERGAGRGARLGYPTANLGQIDTLLPGEGVYAGRAWTPQGPFPAAISIGPNPTFGEAALKVEAHLVGHRGPLSAHPLELDFLARLRDIKRFGSPEHLLAQMDRDVLATRQIVAGAEQAKQA